MDHLYSVFNNAPNPQVRHFLEDGNSLIVSSISNNNILAFASNIDLNDSSETLLVVYVYVVDLNLPYFPYKVAEHKENITTIEWDNKGTKLLLGDENGNIEIWTMRDFLISDWQCIYSHSFPGDGILTGIWFHKGIKLSINYDKKDMNVLYQEKFNFTKIGASVVQFGNMHTDGYLCITSTGLVYAHLFCSDGKFITGHDFLGNCRMKIDKIDISYRDGNFLVITSNGNSKMPVSCFQINVTVNIMDKQKLKITCKSFTSFTLNSILSSNTYPTISALKFIVREVPDAVLVVASGSSGSIMELWELRENPNSINSIIQGIIQQKTQKEMQSFNSQSWNYSGCSISSTYITALSTPRFSLFETTPPLAYIIVAYIDKTIKCFYRENLQMLVTVNLSTALTQNSTNGASSGTKLFPNLKGGNRSNSSKLSVIRDIQLTWSNCAMVAIDAYSQLHFFRLSPIIEPCTPMTLNYAQLMLEYSLISGNDYWDILINIKPNFVETLCDRITENFINRQPPSIQQKWMDNVLQLKAALYRCVNSSNNSCKSGDFYSMKMLNAISETIKRLIRAREYQENDGPAEKLSFLIQNKSLDVQFLNVDKILLKLDNKDFCVEPVIQQSFQHLLQWVCDLALYLLASIPQHLYQNKHRVPGAGLIYDIKSLNTIRELLVIIRFWGLINAAYVPSFIKLHDNLDVISLIFKLLSRIVASLPEKIDESIVDECCVLPNYVIIPQMDLCPKSIGVASPALFTNTFPLIYGYGEEPLSMKYNVKVHTIDGATNYYGNRKMDVLRYIAIGTIDENSTSTRCCTRCSSVSLLKTPMRSPAARAWDQQWIKKCFCGGYWRIHSKFN